MNKTTQFILNLIVGFTSFVFFVILLFPLDAMIGHYLAQMETLTKGEWRIGVSSIDASLVFDTEFKDFHLFKKGKEIFSAPTVSADVSLFSLVSGTVNAGFSAEYTKGELSGRVVLDEESSVTLGIDNVSLANLPAISGYLESMTVPVSLTGKIDGDVYFAWSKDLRQKEAEVNLELADVMTGPIVYKAMGVDLPELVLSEGKDTMKIDCRLDKGQLDVKSLKIPGPDLFLEISGNLNTSANGDVSRMNFEGSLGLSEKLTLLTTILGVGKDTEGPMPLSIKGSPKSLKVMLADKDLSPFLAPILSQ